MGWGKRGGMRFRFGVGEGGREMLFHSGPTGKSQNGETRAWILPRLPPLQHPSSLGVRKERSGWGCRSRCGKAAQASVLCCGCETAAKKGSGDRQEPAPHPRLVRSCAGLRVRCACGCVCPSATGGQMRGAAGHRAPGSESPADGDYMRKLT